MKNNKHRSFCVFLFVSMILLYGLQVDGVLLGYDFRGWYPSFIVLSILTISDRAVISDRNFYLCYCFIFIDSIFAAALLGTGFLNSFFQLCMFFSLVYVAFKCTIYMGIELIIKCYLLASILLSIAVFIESVLFLISPEIHDAYFKVGEVNWLFVRASGLLGEPSDLALFLPQGLFIALCYRKLWHSVAILFSIILSSSFLTIIGLIVAILLFLLRESKGKWPISKTIFSIIVGGFLIIAVPSLSDRVLNIIAGYDGLLGGSIEINFEVMAGTVATIVMNLLVAKSALIETFGIGYGFGNFSLAHSVYFPTFVPRDWDGVNLFYNQKGGGSILIRAATEMGALGVFGLIFVLTKLYQRYSSALINSLQTPGQARVRITYFGLCVITFTVYVIRKDSWFNFFFALSIASLFVALRRDSKCE